MNRTLEKLCEMLEAKLKERSEKGLNNTSDVDVIYKMVDILKDIKNIEYWETKGEYYEAEMGGGYSEAYGDGGYSAARRRRDSRGRYSRDGGSSYESGSSYENGSSYDDNRGRGGSRGGRGGNRGGYSRDGGEAYDRYMDSKQSYRNGGGSDCKQRLMATLDEYMDNFSEQMEEMLRDADCAEERETIQRYLRKLKDLG